MGNKIDVPVKFGRVKVNDYADLMHENKRLERQLARTVVERDTARDIVETTDREKCSLAVRIDELNKQLEETDRYVDQLVGYLDEEQEAREETQKRVAVLEREVGGHVKTIAHLMGKYDELKAESPNRIIEKAFCKPSFADVSRAAGLPVGGNDVA